MDDEMLLMFALLGDESQQQQSSPRQRERYEARKRRIMFHLLRTKADLIKVLELHWHLQYRKRHYLTSAALVAPEQCVWAHDLCTEATVTS